MNTENICLSSEIIEISENTSYLELTSRICYYDDVNKNNVLLPSEGAAEKAETLINMPVQAKYRVNIKGEPTFGGHEVHKDQDGNFYFDTSSIGTHTEVYIENADVKVNGTIKNLPCLYAKYRIWKRYENYVAAVRRLFSLGKLYGSWEIIVSSYEFNDGIKTITDYEFIANTLLGYENASPAYGVDAKAISLSTEENNRLLVAEALSQDIISQGSDKLNNQEKEDDVLNKDEKNIASSEVDIQEVYVDETIVAESNDASDIDSNSDETSMEEVNDVSEKKDDDVTDEDDDKEKEVSKRKKCRASTDDEKEVSALTYEDLYQRVDKACRDKIDVWCYISFWFPEEHEAWCRYGGGETELDLLKFGYTVSDDGTVSVSDPEKVVLSISPANINTTVSEYEKAIAEKDEVIIKASSEITSLKSENIELSQYREKFTQMEQEKIAAELAEKKEALIASVVKSGQITKEEIETSEELSGYVDNLDKKSLMAIVGERLSASVNSRENADVETSSTEKVHVASNLNTDDDEMIDKASIMRKFLGK